jgi:L-rhamnose isomerase
MRNVQKALLSALLTPSADMALLQDSADFTKLFALSEELKTMPFGDVWDEYLARCGAPVGMEWFDKVSAYEKEILAKRQQ